MKLLLLIILIGRSISTTVFAVKSIKEYHFKANSPPGDNTNLGSIFSKAFIRTSEGLYLIFNPSKKTETSLKVNINGKETEGSVCALSRDIMLIPGDAPGYPLYIDNEHAICFELGETKYYLSAASPNSLSFVSVKDDLSPVFYFTQNSIRCHSKTPNSYLYLGVYGDDSVVVISDVNDQA